METKVIEWNQFGEAVTALKQGEVVLFPTETVYGIACISSNEKAFEALKEAKGRPENKPFTLMCSSITQAVMYCQVNRGISAVLKEFTPGEITLLLKGRKGIPHCIDLGTGVVGVRIPNDIHVLKLIEAVGEPLLVSSANLSGDKAASTFAKAYKTFNRKAPIIITGACVSALPSTIVDLTGDEPKLIRQGSVPFESAGDVYRNSKSIIALGCDHGGFEYKEAIKEHLRLAGYEVLDCGTNGLASVDYPIYGKAVAEKVAKKEANLGIVVCTSGEGISIAANKVPGIRCAIGYDDVASGKSREHNDANVISFGQKYMALEDVLRRVDIFLSEKFSLEEKHHRRVGELE